MTVKLKALAAVALVGALTTKCVAAVGLTRTAPLVPVIEPLVVSVAVTVWLPAVLNVALLKVPVPPVNVTLAARVAETSLLVKWTVPA